MWYIYCLSYRSKTVTATAYDVNYDVPLPTSLLRSRTLFQVDRVLKPGGIVGLVSINLPACVDSVTMDTARLCMFDLVNQYGSPEKVKLLFENYKNLVVPYPTRKDHMVDIFTTWTLDNYVDVCMTYSTINRMIKRKGLTVEEGREQYVQLLRERGMTELDTKSVYTWSHLCTLVTASKP